MGDGKHTHTKKAFDMSQSLRVIDNPTTTTFQKVLQHIMTRLTESGYHLYHEYVVDLNAPHRKKIVCTIQDFVERSTNYSFDFEAWTWVANPPSNFRRLINFMTERRTDLSVAEISPPPDVHILAELGTEFMTRHLHQLCRERDAPYSLASNV